MTDGRRLSPDSWRLAALEQMAEAGASSVSVEGLARRLGVTKGSFYHHFADRAALIDSSLRYWEEQATEQIIARISPIADPGERLHTLLRQIFAEDARNGLDGALATSVDAAVAPVVARVTDARIETVAEALRQLGLEPAAARRRAEILYAVYVGHTQLARSADAMGRRPGWGAEHIDDVAALLLVGLPGS